MITIWLLLSLASVDRPPASPYQLNAEALEQFKQARYREAEKEFQRALDAWTYADPVKFARDRAVTMLNLGTVLRIESRYAEAEPLLAEALWTLEAESGPESLDCARAASALAAVYRAWAKPVAAEPLAKRAWTILERTPSATRSDRATVVLLLAGIYMDERKDADLEALVRGVDDPLAVRVYNDLAAAAIRRGDLDRAESYASRALEMAPSALPESHPVRAAVLNNLAQVRRFQGRYLEAEQDYRAAIGIWEKAVGPRHPDTAKGMLNLAALNHERGREAAAEELYRRAAAIFAEAYGESHELTLVARAELAEVLRVERRYLESERLSEATLPALETRLGAADPRVVRAFGNYHRLVAEKR
jgi:tetratricopeptide (TPR) repeat protein